MTTAIAAEVERRRLDGGRRLRAKTFDAGMVEFSVGRLTEIEVAASGATEAVATELGELTADERSYYRTHPVEFAREVLGVQLWARQVEVLEALVENKRVAVASGRKIGKSLVAAVAAIWYYLCFPKARVIITAVTGRQVDGIIWREVRRLVRNATRPIDGVPKGLHELARSGLRAPDLREIIGFTARESEAVAGISGTNLLYIADEASAIDADIFDAIEGNSAGAGCRLLMISNPTRTSGRFFEAFHQRKDMFRTIHVSSEEVPEGLDDALASPAWCAMMRADYGEDSAWYKVHVRGEFVLNETGRVVSLHAIGEAEARWFDVGEETGRLFIGIDPAGPAQGGDESAFAVRRGKKVVEVFAMRGLSADAHLTHVRGVIARHRKPRDPVPVVVLDSEGQVGAQVYGTFRAHVEAHPNEFELVRVRSSEKWSVRQKEIYPLVRDELWANLAAWLKDGGALPQDTKLEQELHAPEWQAAPLGRIRITPKDELRKVLGRSPDRADAVCLAVWQPMAFTPAGAGEGARAASGREAPDDVGPFDPYAGEITPYGGDL